MEYEYVLIQILTDGTMKGMGARTFKAPLHKGDFIILSEDVQSGEAFKYVGGLAYEVIAVKLAAGSSAVGDAMLKFIGSDHDLNGILREEV